MIDLKWTVEITIPLQKDKWRLDARSMQDELIILESTQSSRNQGPKEGAGTAISRFLIE